MGLHETYAPYVGHTKVPFDLSLGGGKGNRKEKGGRKEGRGGRKGRKGGRGWGGPALTAI